MKLYMFRTVPLSIIRSLFSVRVHSEMVYISVSQSVVRGQQVVLGFCPCGPFRLNITPKKTEKIKLT